MLSLWHLHCRKTALLKVKYQKGLKQRSHPARDAPGGDVNEMHGDENE